MDFVTTNKRSQMMSGIKGKNTRPELKIRKVLHHKGFRYRLYQKNLPGKPDIILKKWNTIIFINGCFWHGHGCNLFKWPSTRENFWRNKINTTKERDQKNISQLKDLGWKIIIIWECALKGKHKLDFDYIISKIDVFLKSNFDFQEIKSHEQ